MVTWLKEALALLKQLADRPLNERAELLAAHAGRTKKKLSTVRREYAAAKYVNETTSPDRQGDIRAGLIAIEQFRRLESLAPNRAERIRDEVFSGRLTQRAVIEQVREVVARRYHHGRRNRFLDIDRLLETVRVDRASLKMGDELSAIGRFLNVGAEAKAEDSRDRYAFYASVEISVSGAVSFTFAHQLRSILAACLFYDKVFVACQRSEIDEFRQIADCSNSGAVARVEMIDLYEEESELEPGSDD